MRATIRGRSASPPPLAEIHHGFSDIAGPVGRQHAAPDMRVKRRMRPITHPAHQPVLDRVEMHVVDVPLEIALVPDRVLPEAPLPERVFAIAMAFDRYTGGNKPMRECALIRRQRPEKSESPEGSVQMACRWSGRITMASIVNGRSCRAIRNAIRKALT